MQAMTIRDVAETWGVVVRMANGIFVFMFRGLAYADTDHEAARERLRREVLGG